MKNNILINLVPKLLLWNTTLFLFVTSVLIFNSCSDSNTNPPDVATLNFYSELVSPIVRIAAKSGSDNHIQITTVDSIHISRLRTLISGFNLLSGSDDSLASGKIIKTGPFVISIDSTGQMTEVGNIKVSSGVYDRIKFEFHRFSSNELSQYVNDPVFGPFATQDRLTVIIEGTVFSKGQASKFVYNSNMTANLMVNLDPILILSSKTSVNVSLQFIANTIFKLNNDLIDPRDPGKISIIENAIKTSIKAVKK